MDAVGRIGRYISQGMYTVTGTFHPFGGAVDIIVVQQEDGSFKSSPWYVRFGKFQGVLKSKENVITISVNGVEAGFNMYLNSKGEAFFLRESRVGEGGFVLSCPTFGDEMEGPTENGVFEKIHSFNVEDGQRELVTQVDHGNGKILTRTNSKGSGIFSFVFGRKTDNNANKNQKGDNVARDHAEIAAGLLEMKWSTNLTSSDQIADICVPDEECLQAPLPNRCLDCDEKINYHHERMDDNFRRGIASKNCSEEKDDDPSCLSINRETIDTYTTANSDQANSNQRSSELIVINKNPVFYPQNFDLDVDETRLGGNHMKNDLTENNLDEGQSNENDCHDTGSVASYDDATQSHTESCVGSTAGISTCKNGKEEIASFNTCEIIERPTIRFSIFDEKSSECLDLVSCGIEHSKDGLLCNTSSMIPNVTSLSESVASLGTDISNSCCKQKLETLGSNGLFVSEKSQYHSPRNGSLRDPDNSVLNTESNPSSNFELISSDLPCFSNQELIKYDHRFICTDTRAKESANETEVQQIDLLGHLSHLGVREDSQIPSFPVSVSSINSDAAVESHSISEIPNSSNSVSAPQKSETIEFNINLKKSYSLEGLNDVPDFSIISKPTEAAEYLLEDVQFPFSDISSDSAKEMKIELANNDKVDEVYQFTDTVGRNVGEHNLHIKKDEQSPSRMSDDLRFNSGQINIHGCKVSPGETELSSISLPTIHSHIKDCGGHNLQHSLGCSLKSVADMYGLVVLKNEDSSSSKLEEKPQTEAVKIHTSGIPDIDISANNDEDQQGPITSMNSDKFASASKLEEKPQTKAIQIHTSSISDIDFSTNNNEDQQGPMTSMNSGKFASASKLEEKPQTEATKIHTSGIPDIDISANNDEDQQGPMTSMNSGKFASASKLEEKPQTEAIKIHTSGISDIDFSTNNDEDQQGPITSMNSELSLYEKLLLEGMSADAAQQVFDVEKEKISEPPGVIPVDGAEKNDGASRSLAPSQGSWNLWPFLTRSKTVSCYEAACEDKKKMHVDMTSKSSSNLNPGSAMKKAKKPMMVQSLTPTSEELASLNLKEGQNVVKFSFSTPMLGMQQVDARIYLWKWNTRIIISDVDGTITKSDVLGQFMPLVGIDWSQTGVAHLFSAIKENGYQLLFLSARAISQAHLTRQFLFNLKQDGKALPDGPVIISPDGLFPSLYREVIRRAPHEFKISCLEVIKELFPLDCNPFYAGFGNRDTDEFSYLKVGIPIGKIFIINPKGRIVVNRQVDTTSYASLHDLVNGIFPPMSSFEQEDYNSWNYWKLPLLGVDM